MAITRIALLATAVVSALPASPARGQWRPDSVPVCTSPETQDFPIAVSDGRGGAFIVWRDNRNALSGGGLSIFGQHLLVDGSVAPGWPIDGAPVVLDSA